MPVAVRYFESSLVVPVCGDTNRGGKFLYWGSTVWFHKAYDVFFWRSRLLFGISNRVLWFRIVGDTNRGAACAKIRIFNKPVGLLQLPTRVRSQSSCVCLEGWSLFLKINFLPRRIGVCFRGTSTGAGTMRYFELSILFPVCGDTNRSGENWVVCFRGHKPGRRANKSSGPTARKSHHSPHSIAFPLDRFLLKVNSLPRRESTDLETVGHF